MLIYNPLTWFREQPAEVVPNTGEVAYSESSLYATRDNEKYNPDTLIGVKGYAIYGKMMEDEQVKSVVTFKRDAITARDFLFEFTDHQKEQLSDEEQEKRLTVFNSFISEMRGSFLDALNAIMTGMYNGYSLTEKVYETVTVKGTPWVGVKRLKKRPFATFYFHVDDYGNILQVTQKVDEREHLVNINKFIHYVHNPEVDEHYGGSDLRSAHRSWYSKRLAISNYNIYLERMAGGLVVMSAKENKTISKGTALYTSIINILKNIQVKTSIFLPNVVELKIEHPPTGGKAEYPVAIAMYDKGISKAMLVPNLLGITEQGSTGSFAQSKTQLEAFMWTLDADAMRLAEVCNEQLFRELGDINFGDGLYPLFKFKDLSDDRKFKIAESWVAAVKEGAVTHTESDEAHTRKLLGYPAIEEDSDPLTSLEGEQITALMEIINSVVAGKIEKDTAVEIIVNTFPIEREAAEVMLKDVEVKEIEEPAPEVDKEGNPISSGDAGAIPSGSDTDAGAIPAKPANASGATSNSRVAATSLDDIIPPAIFARAEKRTDFAVIDRKATAIEQEGIAKMSKALGAVAIDMISDIPTDSLTGDDIKTVKVKASHKSKFNKIMQKVLREAWSLGKTHAEIEVLKAAEEPKFTFIATPLSAEAAELFFENRAADFALSLSENTRKKISVILFNGIKFNWTSDEITNRITQEIASITATQISTAVRTSVFEAINEARYNYFSDPELGNFVEALRYSAILDGRTTSICRHLNGRTYPKESVQWQSYRPPNHFNCRSLLIAVTTFDTWSESSKPKLEPQEGFGR